MEAADDAKARAARFRKKPEKTEGGLCAVCPSAANVDVPEVADVRVCTRSAGFMTAKLHKDTKLMKELLDAGVKPRGKSTEAVCVAAPAFCAFRV